MKKRNPKYKNALEFLNAQTPEVQDYCLNRLLDQPSKELVDQILELIEPYQLHSLVQEARTIEYIDSKLCTEAKE